MNRKRFDKLMKRLSTGELTDAERRELNELCADSDLLRAEVRETEAILAAAHAAEVEPPSEFEWAAFSTRLKATIESEAPRPYGQLRLWLTSLGLSPAFSPKRLAVAASAVAAVAIAVLIAVIALRPGTPPEKEMIAWDVPEPEWTLSEIQETYALPEILPDEEVLALEQKLWKELDEVDQVIEGAPSFNDDGTTDEEYILG